MSTIKERFLTRYWVFVTIGLIISISSIFFAYKSYDLAKQTNDIENKHYQELIQPHTQKEDIFNKIEALNNTLPGIEKWIDSIEISGKDVSNLRDGFQYIASLVSKCVSEFNNDDLINANDTIVQASELAYDIRSTPLDLPFPQPKVFSSPSYISFNIESDLTTKATTKDGSPIDQITASLDSFQPTDGSILLTSYNINPDEIYFDKLVKITIAYDSLRIPEDFELKRLELAAWNYDTGSWKPIHDNSLNFGTYSISFSTKHITKLAVFAIPKKHLNIDWLVVGFFSVVFVLIIIILLALFLPEPRKPEKPKLIILHR